MTTKHTLTYADMMFAGNCYFPPYSDDYEGRRSLAMPHLFTHEFGSVDTADSDGIASAVTPTGAGDLSSTGVLVSGGVATFDVPRAVSLTSTANLSGFTFTASGTDFYGQVQTENITGPNNTTVDGAKAFATINKITATGATGAAMSAGSSNVLGLPIRIANKGKVLGLFCDGVAEGGGAIVAGFSATGEVSTATTADVRGTVTPTTAPNGTKLFTINLIADHTSKELAFGAAPA